MEERLHPPIESLRLMRFSFEPNEALLAETENLVQASLRGSTSFRFYATRQLLLSVPDWEKHEVSLQRLKRGFTKYDEPIQVKPVIGCKDLDNGITRYQMQTTDQAAFDALTSLEVTPDTRFDNYVTYEHPPVEQLPNLIEKQPASGHYLFVDIATKALAGAHERDMVEKTFVSQAKKHVFYFHKLGFNSIRDIHRTIQQPQASYYQYRDDDQLSEAV